jgi:hypothetical protein
MNPLFNLNVDTLFESSSISEIEAVNRKIQNETDSKKEELRMLVRKIFFQNFILISLI